MSRLDSFIRRMQAQRDCINHVADQVHGLPGPILELGLGNGRTYDHLRELFPGRDIYVFERQVRAHPDCIPPDDRLFLGDITETLPRARAQLGATAILAHSDLGTGDKQANEELGRFLGPALDALMAPGGLVLANQKLHVARWNRLPEPPGVKPDRYFILFPVSTNGPELSLLFKEDLGLVVVTKERRGDPNPQAPRSLRSRL